MAKWVTHSARDVPSTFLVKTFQVWPHEKHLKTHSPCILSTYLPEVPIPASLPASIDLCRQNGTSLPGAGAVQSKRQRSQAWQEMLGRRKVEWCWELEERRREKKSALRPRPATGRESGAQRAKLWRGGEVRRVWGVRSTLLGERTFLRCQLIARSPVPLCRARLSSLLSFCPETGAWGLPCTP